MQKFSQHIKKHSFLSEILLGAIAIFVSYLVISLITSLILFNTVDPTRNIGLYSIFSMVLAGAVGSGAAALFFGKESKLAPSLSSLTVFILFIIFCIVFSGGIGISQIINGVLFEIASMLSVFLTKRKRPRGQYRKRAR